MFAATQHGVCRHSQECGTFDLQVLGRAPEVCELWGLDCCLLHPHFDVSFIGEVGNESASKAFEFTGAMNMAAVSITKMHCFRDKVFLGESSGQGGT